MSMNGGGGGDHRAVTSITIAVQTSRRLFDTCTISLDDDTVIIPSTHIVYWGRWRRSRHRVVVVALQQQIQQQLQAELQQQLQQQVPV
jgi:hypothetical protein